MSYADFIDTQQIFPFKDFLNISLNYSSSPGHIFLLIAFYYLFNDFFQLPANEIDPVHEANLHLKPLYAVVKNTGCDVSSIT